MVSPAKTLEIIGQKYNVTRETDKTKSRIWVKKAKNT